MIIGQQLENTIMTDNMIANAMEGVTVKHFDIQLDKDGNEIRIEVNPKDEKTETETQPS